jgi:AcrR family transcriptional regulator
MSTADRKERERLRRRNEIVDAAEKLFLSKGIDSVTMDDIAKDTELARGTLYLYFKNKDEICIAIATRGLKVLNGLFRETARGDDSGLAKLRRQLYALYEFYKKYAVYYATISYLQGRCYDMSDYQGAEEMNEANRDTIRLVMDAFAEGLEDGTVSQDTDPLKTAMFLQASMQSVINLAPYTGMPPEEFVEYSVGLMLRSFKGSG